MGPEIWVGAAALFLAGGAIGSAGTLLTQWILKKLDVAPPGHQLGAPEYAVVRKELAELGRQMRNVDARLDFTEQLLGGALPLAPPPDRIEIPAQNLDVDLIDPESDGEAEDS